MLDSNEGTPYTTTGIGRNFDTAYGTFRLTTQGREVSVQSILANEELFSKPKVTVTNPVPTNNNRPTGTLTSTGFSSSSGSQQLIIQAWLTNYLGLARNVPNQTRSANISFIKPGGPVGGPTRLIVFTVQATSRFQVTGQNYLNANANSPFIWQNIRYTAQANLSEPGWSVGDGFTVRANVNNNFSRYAASIGQGYSFVDQSFRVNQVVDLGGPTNPPQEEITGDRSFEIYSQVSDCSHYLELEKSNFNGAEHEITWVNEYITNESLAEYNDMTTVALSIKSTGEIANIEQLRLYSDTGIPVRRLIEGDIAPSNLFADLVLYLLENKSQGVGNAVPTELVDEESLRSTAIFLRANKIFYDGVIEDSESFRQFLYDNASLQLCAFTIKNGRFGMIPAVPTAANGEISLAPIAVDQIFTAGNIVEDSLELQFIDVSQRSDIRALVTWRVTEKNDLPYKASALVTWSDVVDTNSTEQSFDLSEFCTNREQALRTARFLMSTRRRITKLVSFKTVPDALGVQPGSYIRVITEASTYSSTATGQIADASTDGSDPGSLITISSVADGNYDALLYNPATQDIVEANITITNNTITDTTYHGNLFTLLSTNTDNSIYQIESLNLEEDGLVSISAVEVPTDASGVSIVARDVLTASNFTVLE